MNRRRTSLLVTLLLALVSLAHSSAAQATEIEAVRLPETLSLDEALRLFRQHGLDLLVADAQVMSAEGDLQAAGFVPNPSWQLFGSYLLRTDRGVTPWGVSAGIGDSNALEDSLSGKRGLRLKVAKTALAAARMNRLEAQRQLELQVKSQYISAVLARDALDFALLVREGATQIFQLNQTRYHAGAISEADLAKVETAKLEAEQGVDSATQLLRAAKVGLAYLLGVRGAVPDYKVDQDLPKFAVPSGLATVGVDQLIADARSHRPDLKAWSLQRQRADASVALARRLRVPDISLNAQYQQQGPFAANAPQPPSVSFGLIGTLPLFYLQRGEILRAEADRRTQEVGLAKAEAQLVSDVEAAYNAFVSSRKLVERMEARLLDRSKRARDLVSLQYQKGAASLLEYLDAQRTFIANNIEYLQDLSNYWTAVFALEAAVGMDLR